MMMLAQRWSYLVQQKPTISQRYNGLPTLAQRSHDAWEFFLNFRIHNYAGDRGSISGRDRPKSLKTGSDSSTAKRSATGVSVTGPRR